MNIGVLAVQGAFAEHITMLSKLNINTVELREKSDLKNIDGLILPGGESTTLAKLLLALDLARSIVNMVNSELPIFGTCACMILLAQYI